jgi:hypothetical protein
VNRLSARLSMTVIVAACALAACGGGGGGGTGSGGGGGIGAPPSVSGDMIAYQTSRGWNYHGNAFGYPAVTVSIYADPPSGATLALVMFAGVGTAADALSGTKEAGLGLANSGSGYNATAYVLLNNGAIYAQGAIAGQPTLVPSTLVQGQSFATYPGVTATVQSVGAVPGASACPSPGTGATVLYTFAGQKLSRLVRSWLRNHELCRQPRGDAHALVGRELPSARDAERSSHEHVDGIRQRRKPREDSRDAEPLAAVRGVTVGLPFDRQPNAFVKERGVTL